MYCNWSNYGHSSLLKDISSITTTYCNHCRRWIWLKHVWSAQCTVYISAYWFQFSTKHFSVLESYIFGTLKTTTVKYALHQSYFTKESLKCQNDFICFKSYVQLHYSSRVWCRILITFERSLDIVRHSTHTKAYFSVFLTPLSTGPVCTFMSFWRWMVTGRSHWWWFAIFIEGWQLTGWHKRQQPQGWVEKREWMLMTQS